MELVERTFETEREQKESLVTDCQSASSKNKFVSASRKTLYLTRNVSFRKKILILRSAQKGRHGQQSFFR